MDGGDFSFDYFISRRGTAAVLAKEAADVLAAAGYKVRVQDYDFAASGQFVRDIDDALKQCRHLLILHTADYHDSFWTRSEFHNFLAAVAVSDGRRRIGVLRCDSGVPGGLLHSATFGDLFGEDDPAKRRDIILAVAEGRAPASRPVPRLFGGAMPLENRLFTGRGALLADMHAALSVVDGTAALTQAAVHGLGGVGKTSLAREYVARHGDGFDSVWWIIAADRLGTMAGLAELARAMDPRLPPDTPTEQAAIGALREIEKRRGRFLLVYDNAPGPEALTGLLPARGACVLVTSRNPDWDSHAAALPVAEMPLDEAVALLQRRAGREDAAGAERLARELGCLPLALDQAAAYAKATRCSFDGYTRRVEALIRRPNRNPDYPVSVAATFELAIEHAGAAAEAVLGQFAWFAPERIPLMLLDNAMPEEEREAALAALTAVSLVTAGPEGDVVATVSVHRLVQAVVRGRLTARCEDAVGRDAALGRLVAAFPYGYRDAAVWPLCRLLLPHQQALARRLAAAEPGAGLSKLLNLAACFLEGSGDASAAVPLYRRALESRERVLGAEHPDTLGSVNNLAYCLETLGDAPAALPLYRRALEGHERVLGAEHPDTLISVGNLASCLQALGDASAALPLYRRALGSRERVLGAEHPDTLSSAVLGSNRHHTIAAPIAPASYYICHGTVTHHPRPDRKARRGIRPDRGPGRTHPAGTRGPGAHRRHAPAVRPRRDTRAHRRQASDLAQRLVRQRGDIPPDQGRAAHGYGADGGGDDRARGDGG